MTAFCHWALDDRIAMRAQHTDRQVVWVDYDGREPGSPMYLKIDQDGPGRWVVTFGPLSAKITIVGPTDISDAIRGAMEAITKLSDQMGEALRRASVAVRPPTDWDAAKARARAGIS